MSENAVGFPYWKAVCSFILDFLTAFFLLGFAVAWLTGNLADGSFALSGAPALIFFASIVAYFIVFNRFLGGTIWRRIFGVAPVRS
ncbi:hypothetical protein [Aquamicrobium sp. LC103]|uniref:hypothetical protein n=1 Tax=Aquamicrobium sp. LC103 TaxID=1120658 RepID=UPI00063EACB3|nr:hypothetical protein [Aquamicrobium sp. LC103]TKT76705.1 hypothetical protein XW59_014645 [Aquamicrobium sp. LC103]